MITTYQFKNGFSTVINYEKGCIDAIKVCGNTLVQGSVPFFAVKLRTRKGASRVIDASACRFIGEKEGGFAYAHAEMDVQVFVCEQEDGLNWRISVKNKTEDLLEWVELASFGVNEKLKEEEGGVGEIVYPFNEGCLVSDMKKRENYPFRYIEPEYPSLGKYSVFPNMISSQFLAYIADGKGVYYAMHDEDRTPKHVDFKYGDGCIRLLLRVFCNVNYGEDYQMPFDCVLKFFDGGWQDACEIYRAWFEKHLPVGVKKIKENKDLPAWYGESPLIVAYPVRGKFDTDVMDPNGLYPYENALPLLTDMADKTQSKVMSLLMHWEGTAPWAPPYMWPPYGGEALFTKYIEKAHEKDILVGLYCSGLGWTQQSNLIAEYNKEEEFEKDGLAEIMCANSDGALKGAICKDQRSGYDLCPAMEKSKTLFANEMNKLVKSGVDYVQAMDQNHGGGSYFCYSDKHGHVPAPGKWQVEETRALLDRVENEKVLLGCESAAAEPFIGKLQFSDNRFELCYYVGLPIPLYSYIYHEYVNNFMGNQICHMLSEDEYDYTYRLAHSFVCGDMLTAVIDDKGNIAYAWGGQCFKKHTDGDVAKRALKNFNGWRQKIGKRFLHTGRMIKPMHVTCEEKNSFLLEDDIPFEVEKIMTSAYEYEGEKAQFIVNYNLAPVTVKLEKNADVYDDCEKETASFKNVREVEIQPLSAVMIKEI